MGNIFASENKQHNKDFENDVRSIFFSKESHNKVQTKDTSDFIPETSQGTLGWDKIRDTMDENTSPFTINYKNLVNNDNSAASTSDFQPTGIDKNALLNSNTSTYDNSTSDFKNVTIDTPDTANMTIKGGFEQQNIYHMPTSATSQEPVDNRYNKYLLNNVMSNIKEGHVDNTKMNIEDTPVMSAHLNKEFMNLSSDLDTEFAMIKTQMLNKSGGGKEENKNNLANRPIENNNDPDENKSMDSDVESDDDSESETEVDNEGTTEKTTSESEVTSESQETDTAPTHSDDDATTSVETESLSGGSYVETSNASSSSKKSYTKSYSESHSESISAAIRPFSSDDSDYSFRRPHNRSRF